MLKQSILVVSFFVISYFATAQNKWEVGAMAAYDYSLFSEMSDENPRSFKDNSGFEVGLQAFRKITRHVYFNTGLNIVRKRFTEGGVTQYGYSNTGTIRSLWTDLNVPVYFNIRIPVAKRLSIASTLGVTFGWDIKDTYIFSSADGSVIKSSRQRTWEPLEKWFPSFGLGVLYKIDNRLSLMVLPHVMTGFNDFVTSYDLRATLIYNFNKSSKADYVKE